MRLPEAFEEIKTASDMDPTLTFTMRWRMELDRALGNKADFERTRAEFEHVVAVTREDPNPDAALRLARRAPRCRKSRTLTKKPCIPVETFQLLLTTVHTFSKAFIQRRPLRADGYQCEQHGQFDTNVRPK